MGIIVRNLSSSGLSNIRISKTEREFPFKVYDYPFDDDYVIVTPESSSTSTTYVEDGFTFSSSCIYQEYTSTSKAFRHDGNSGYGWLSCSSGSGNTRAISVAFPVPFKIDAFRLRGYNTSGVSTTLSFTNGKLEGYSDGIWETLHTIGSLPGAYVWQDIVELNLTKSYNAYRIVGTGVVHISNRYVGLGAFHLLAKK